MSTRIKVHQTRLRVYSFAIEGYTQASIACLIPCGRSNAWHHVTALEKEYYIRLVQGTKNPKLYEKGERGAILDSIMLYDSGFIDATGVIRESRNTYRVATIDLHHLKVKMNVTRTGDLVLTTGDSRAQTGPGPAFQKRKKYPSVERYYGTFIFQNCQTAVEYERTPSLETFYLHAPALTLTGEQIRDWKIIVMDRCRSIVGAISKHSPWRFGPVEFTDWKPHFAYELRSLKGISEKIDVMRSDGGIWTSNSNGVPEIETSEPILAIAILEMPKRVVQLEARVRECESLIRELVKEKEVKKSNQEKPAGKNDHEPGRENKKGGNEQ